jgi:hypothetical protein
MNHRTTIATIAFGALAAAAAMPGAAQAQTSAAVQAVHDKDVFEQNKTILKQSTEASAAVKELNSTIQAGLTRSRALGGVASSVGARATVADDGETDAAINATYARVRQLGCARPEKDGSVLPAEQMGVCKKIEQSAFAMVKMLRANLTRSRQRAVLIDALLAELDKTGAGNLKDSADLANRIQVETALLQNEKTMIDIALANNEQQMRLYSQLLAALDRDSPGDAAGNNFGLRRK